MANYQTAAALYEAGVLKELVLFCSDEPDEEMQAAGMLHWDFVAPVEQVVQIVKAGGRLSAWFKEGAESVSFPVEIVTLDGHETLEVANVGQPAEFRQLRNLSKPI
jgi:hypothetical protein